MKRRQTNTMVTVHTIRTCKAISYTTGPDDSSSDVHAHPTLISFYHPFTLHQQQRIASVYLHIQLNCWQHSNCIHIFCQICSSNYRQVYRDNTWFLGPHTCDLVQSWQKKYPYHTYTYQMCTKSDMHMYKIAKYNM